MHLPYLALEANAPLPSPSAVVEHGRILLADQAASEAGVAQGVGVAAARMLAPTIALLMREPAREAAALQRLACWAGGLTPKISLTADTLLLEIGSCLRLFGGVRNIVRAAAKGVREQGFSLTCAVAPTPLGAQWLAQTAKSACCLDAESLHRHLASLPISVLPDKTAQALARFGARTLGGVRRLPSAALARRIGAPALQLMARAFGEIADPRPAFVFPEQFALVLQLPAAVDNAGALLFAARRLTAALAGWLRARQAGVRAMALHLRQRQGETLLSLEFAELTADEGRFERVLRERLNTLTLNSPVESLALVATTVAALAGRSQTLFDDASSGNEAIAPLLERLCARLGEEQVYRVVAHADHRPECATRRTGPFDKSAKVGQPAPGTGQGLARPLWLLDAPESLREVDGRPFRGGPLQLLAGPERIESGWWDGGEQQGDLRRDYFIALASDARWLWIYRECRSPAHWYLHGVFA